MVVWMNSPSLVPCIPLFVKHNCVNSSTNVLGYDQHRLYSTARYLRKVEICKHINDGKSRVSDINERNINLSDTEGFLKYDRTCDDLQNG